MATKKITIGPPSQSVALIVGAGAVQNAWQPILRALRPILIEELTAMAKEDPTPDMANVYLAKLVYLMRWHHTNLVISEGSDLWKGPLATHYSKVCEAIRSELVSAEKSKELIVRPEFENMMNRFVMPGLRTLMLVNANWDTVADKAAERRLVRTHDGTLCSLHLHGCASKAEALYLPSEMTREPYRTPEEDMKFGTMHGSIMEALETVDRAVIYGLSLDPLDAELLQTLESGWRVPEDPKSSRLRTVHIVNPCHELVAGRVRLLLHDDRVEIIGHHPSELS